MSNPDDMPDDPVSALNEVSAPEAAPEVASAELASAAERAFVEAVAAAEAVRQQAKAAAFTAHVWNSVNVNLMAYERALTDADVAYQAAVNTARDRSPTADDPVCGVGFERAELTV
jgi:hypothetical protein